MQEHDLLLRVQRLERANRLWAVVAFLIPAVLLASGWAQAPQPYDVIRTNKLEVVDMKGVPLVTLAASRGDEGGSIVLRDKLGERRGWWNVSPEGGTLAIAREATAGEEAANTAGFSVTPSSAEMNLLGAKGAMFTASIREEKPRLDLWDASGKTLFGAPWVSSPAKP